MKIGVINKDLFEFEGRSPTGSESRRLFRLSPERLLAHFHATGNTSMFDEAWLIPDVCDMPSGIWRGLGRANQDAAFCYAGAPTGEFAKRFGIEPVVVPRGRVFLVFMTDQLEVTKWRQCQEDPLQPGFPIGHETRFGARSWPKD
jgi:hypothetical protein